MQIPQLHQIFKRNHRASGWFAVAFRGNAVQCAQVNWQGSRPAVKVCASFDVDALSPSNLEKIRRDLHVADMPFSTLLASGEYQIIMVDAPNVPVGELKTAIRWKIKDALSYHVDDATVDVLQIPSGKGGNERPQSLYAVAASNETVRKRIELFEKAKIDLTVIDIPEMAQRNIASLFEGGNSGIAMLSFHEDGGLLTFTSGGELYLARRIEITLGQLQDADERLRQQYLERVELEVQRSLDYFDRQFHQIPISRMLVSAPESLGLERTLAENLGLPVERLDLTQVMDISGVPNLANSEYLSQMLLPLGAALRQERRAL